MDLQTWVANRDAPVASVIPLLDGNLFGTLNAAEGLRCFALFQKVPGGKPSPPWSTRLYEEYGRSAALVHEASTNFPEPAARVRRSLENLLDESLLHIGPWLDGRPGDLESVRRVAESVRHALTPLLPSLSWGVCHGDLSLDNLHVVPNGRVMLFDFDSSCCGWRAWDVCNALGYGSPEHQDGFLRGYRGVSAFSREELSSVPYFVAADVLRMMADEVSRWAKWFGSTRVEAWVDGKLTWLREWEGDPRAT